MAATAAEIPRERDLLSRLAAGTAGVVGAAFLRRLVAELAGALDCRGRVRGRAERSAPGLGADRRQRGAGVELREGTEFELAGTPCEHAYEHELLLVRRGARLRYPEDSFLRDHQLDGYLAIALRAADGRAIGHMGVISSRTLDPTPSELQALRVFGARAAAELERRRHERALQGPRRRGRRLARPRRPGRRRRAPPDRPRPARRRPAAARRARAGAGAGAARARGRPGEGPGAPDRRPRAGRRRQPRAARAGPRAASRRASSAACAARSPRSPPSRRCRSGSTRCPTGACTAVVEATVWFLVSEALSNALKHAAATELRVSAAQHGRTLVAEVVRRRRRRRVHLARHRAAGPRGARRVARRPARPSRARPAPAPR